MSEIIEEVRRAFLAVIADRRIGFAYEVKERFKKFCHEHDFRNRWPAESLRLAQDETRLRTLELKSRLAGAIAAGWKPSPGFNVSQAIQRCFSNTNYDEDPSSDLIQFVRSAFEQVGLPSTETDLHRQQRELGDAQVRAYNLTLHDLQIQATAKHGSYRTVEYNEEFRLRVLRDVHEHFLSSQKTLFTVQVVERLGIENSVENRRAIGNALVYWLNKDAIKAKYIRPPDEHFANVAVMGMTSAGIDTAEGLNKPAAAIQNIYNLNDSPIGVFGSMSGGVFTQNVGSSLDDLATALEQLRDEMQLSEDPLAVAVEAIAEKAAGLARAAHPDRSALERVLSGLGQTVLSVAAAPQAWAFIAVEAAKVGLNIPGPPILPQ